MEFALAFVKLFVWSTYLISPILVMLGLLVTGLGLIVCRLEKWKRFDALYWTFITATTVGYGDIRPQKKVSRVISIVIAFLGLMFTGIIIAITINTVQLSVQKMVDPTLIEKMKKEFK